MTSMRRRTLALVLGLMLLGTLAMTLFNYFDSTHEVARSKNPAFPR